MNNQNIAGILMIFYFYTYMRRVACYVLMRSGRFIWISLLATSNQGWAVEESAKTIPWDAGTEVSNEADMFVSGWPIPDLSKASPPLWFGADPVAGRLTCPPLTRLNLSQKRFEALIFNSVKVSTSDRGKTVWTFGLREGIFWWSGDRVLVDHISKFFKNNLASILAYKTGEIWKIPKFKIRVHGANINIYWQKKPVFGPYIINGVPLWREASFAQPQETMQKPSKLRTFHGRGGARQHLRFECAGIYIATLKDGEYILNPSLKYKASSKVLHLMPEEKSRVETSSERARPSKSRIVGAVQRVNKSLLKINFSSASELPSKIYGRSPDSNNTCRTKVGVPYLSAISWNPSSRLLKNIEMRKLVKQMLPLRTIQSSGTGFFGTLISGLVPRSHPGFHRKLKIPRFRIGEISKKLNSMGYREKNKDGIRVDRSGVPLSIKMGRLGQQISLLEKVLGDVFLSLGIDSDFIGIKESKMSEVDAVIYTARIPWPEMNLLASFHSASVNAFPFKLNRDAQLDEALIAYAKNLSHAILDVKNLKTIQERIARNSSFSPMVHHHLCYSAPSKYSIKGNRMDVRDPDWFRKIVLMR